MRAASKCALLFYGRDRERTRGRCVAAAMGPRAALERNATTKPKASTTRMTTDPMFFFIACITTSAEPRRTPTQRRRRLQRVLGRRLELLKGVLLSLPGIQLLSQIVRPNLEEPIRNCFASQTIEERMERVALFKGGDLAHATVPLGAVEHFGHAVFEMLIDPFCRSGTPLFRGIIVGTTRCGDGCTGAGAGC